MSEHLKPPQMMRTREEAHEANLERAHECLVEAKACFYAAADQAPDDDERSACARLAGDTVGSIERTFQLRFS